MKLNKHSMSVLFLGDVISDNDKIVLSESVRGLLSTYDNVICNLEGPICIGEKLSGSDKVGPRIFQKPSFVDMLINSNIKNFGLANNHIFDYGYEAIYETIEYLKSRSCSVSGICEGSKISPLILKTDSTEICIFNLCETHDKRNSSQNSNFLTYSSLFDDSLITLIEEYKLVNRKIVFYIHAGLETVDVPLPFFRELYQHLVDAGVDLVIGHHPHVIQGMEIYKTGLIYYSIGDFIFNSKNVKRFESVGCGLGLNIVMGELVLTHHYFCQSDDGLLELIDRDLIMDATRKLYNNDYASNMFLTAYKKQILPLRNFAEGRLSRFLPIRTNLSILFRSLFIPVLTKKRRTQFEIHLLENESYRELENLFGRK